MFWTGLCVALDPCLILMYLLQEEGLLPGPETRLLFNTRIWIIGGEMHTNKAEDFIGKGQLGREQRGKGSQEDYSSTRLAVLGHAKSLQSYPTYSLQRYSLKPARLLWLWDLWGKNGGVVAVPSSRGASRPRDQSHISYDSCVVAYSLTSEPPG